MAADDVLDRLGKALGCRNDAALSTELGVAKSTLSSWRSRDSIPYGLLCDIAERRGLSLDYLLLGREVISITKVDAVMFETIGHALWDELRREKMLRAVPSPWHYAALLYNRIARRVRPGANYGEIVEEEVGFLTDVLKQAENAEHAGDPIPVHPEELAEWKRLGIEPGDIFQGAWVPAEAQHGPRAATPRKKRIRRRTD